MTEQKPAVPPPPPVADVWGAALVDGSGRHVLVRRHWPELADALDAAVDAAGAVPDTGHRTDAVAKAAKDALGTWDAMGYLGITEVSDAMERLRDALASASPSRGTGTSSKGKE